MSKISIVIKAPATGAVGLGWEMATDWAFLGMVLNSLDALNSGPAKGRVFSLAEDDIDFGTAANRITQQYGNKVLA